MNYFDFAWAIIHIRGGGKAARSGWNGKNMYIYVHHPERFDNNPEPTKQPYIVMRAADGSFVPWLASQTDLLASDWCEVKS